MEVDLQALRASRTQFRTGMLASLLIFAIVLWLMFTSSAAKIPAIAACLLYLVGIRWLRGRYRRACMRMRALYGIGGNLLNAKYAFSEPCEPALLARLNLTPGVEYWDRPVYRHVLKGKVKNIPVTVAEITFTRRPKSGLPSAAVTGILIRMVTDGQPRFVLMRGNALPWKQVYTGYAAPPTETTKSFPSDATLLTEDGRPLPKSLITPLEQLLHSCDGPLCVASSDEGITALLPHRFYTAHLDYVRDLTEKDFQPVVFPELDLTAELATAYHAA